MQFSEQGTNLIYAVIGGLVIGTVLAFVPVDGTPLTYFLLQYNEAVSAGWFWQLVTSIIIAPPTFQGIEDVVFNAIALAYLDGILSFTYSKRQYYAVFLITGIAGNIFSLANGPNVFSFGASGGIFGLLAGVISFDLVTNRRVNPSLMLWFALIFVVSSFVSSSLIASPVDWIAHAGGALVGLALGYVIGVRRGVDPATM
ncbi:MAG TPA: rhomboid family intramembrane serine protease [Nitrososphaerales archaeon]|nr:rhomboid family intramembrane serine protease [Nitrososphaerales archaeon]